MRIGVIGATGLVGRTMLRIIEERGLEFDELVLAASPRSEGKKIEFKGKTYTVQSMESALNSQLDIALFSAGGSTSKTWAPRFAEKSCFVIDNSSAWRMEEGVPLIVPEVNAHCLNAEQKIIANPNCSTIQLVLVLKVLENNYGLERVVISTYQSVTGTGKDAWNQLLEEREGKTPSAPVYPHRIDGNCLPHCDVFMDNGYTREEMKMQRESRKILELPNLALTATAVRVPVWGGHSESVNITLKKDFEINALKEQLAKSPGVIVQDNPSNNEYPMPLEAEHKDEVFVGRIRRDDSYPRTLNAWIVSDNLRKGAATNAVQIAEELIRQDHWIKSNPV
jgi:aspartate-semialdehyde dehydrogenase